MALARAKRRNSCYVRYGKLRLSAKGRDAALLPEETKARDQVTQALQTLSDRLTPPDVAKLRKQATDELSAAHKLTTAASTRREATHRYRFQTDNDVKW